jgi:repressor LexA
MNPNGSVLVEPFMSKPVVKVSGPLDNSGVPDRSQLRDRTLAILECIEAEIATRGYPPSVREIAAKVGVLSPSTVHAHMNILEKQGFIRRDPLKPRALEVVNRSPSPGFVPVPMVGRVGAGTDILAIEEFEDLLALPTQLASQGKMFVLTVRGDSMIEAGILDGDLVVVRHQPSASVGEIVVAGLPGEEATVKRLAALAPEVVLEPANPAHHAIHLPAEEAVIYGRVIALMRRVD